MPIVSGAVTKSTAPTTWSSADAFAYTGQGVHPLSAYFAEAHAYDAIYSGQLWPKIAITKLVHLQTQLPFKVYRRADKGREDASDTPYGKLIARPCMTLAPVAFWEWTILQYHVHGRAFAVKVRDKAGRPIELKPIHPTRMRYGPANGGWTSQANDDGSRWWFRQSDGSEIPVARSSFIYWRRMHPSHPELGLSPLEPLRDTLENEAGAKAANKAMWLRGGKHTMVLSTSKSFGDATAAVIQRLADQYQAKHGGVENWGRPLVLEDGMTATPLDMTNEDMQYIDARRLNREEVAAAFDIPPPTIGILDRATFSNVTEQNRMLYRLTMPPILQSFESMLDFDLRDGRHGDETKPPDFGELFYFEHLIDGVLRGSTEERTASNALAIQSGQMTPAEARELENRPFIEGSDRLYINTAMVPFDEETAPDPVLPPAPPANPAPAIGGPAQDGGADEQPAPPPPARQLLPAAVVGKVMGRLSRVADLDQLDALQLTAGLDAEAAQVVAQALGHVRRLGGNVAGLRLLIKDLGE